MTYHVEKLCIEPGCFAYREGSTERCASHNFNMRKADRESLKPPKLKKQIKKISDKRKIQNSLYLPSAKSWLIGKRCAVCGDPAAEVHHKAGRANDLLMEKKYWMATCAPCHREIHDNPKWALENDYIILRNSNQIV